MEKGFLTYVTLGVLVWAVLGTVVAAYYFVQYNIYRSEYSDLVSRLGIDVGDISTMLEGISLRANLLVGYGNGTENWHNNTVLPLGSTAFTAIFSVVDSINYTDYGGELGVLVTSINGVANNSTHGWFYWYWDLGNAEWVLPNYSSARQILHRGDTIAFTYANYMIWPPPTPT